MAATSRLTALTLLTLQLLIILVFAVFVDYESLSVSSATFSTLSNSTKDMMMFVLLGFGVIMTYLRSHRWSSAAFTLLISALAVEYYILWSFLWDSVASSNFTRFVTFTQEKFIRGLYATAAILVGYGAFLGRVGPFELVITVLIQVIGYSCN
jgi:ammonium transporter Rh